MELTPEQWHAVEEHFHAAVQLPPGDRRAFIQRQTAMDVLVRSTVLNMLEADQVHGFLDLGVGAAAARLLSASGPAGLPDGLFGPYRVEGVLGEGGMGIVYRAIRQDVGARVALKVLWDAPLSPARRAHFSEEQQILATLRHPGIVPLYDAGVQPDGTPWFAMELVEGGVPITEFARRNTLPVRRRAELLSEVCAAVRAAHERLIVHGDLKPNNILVATDGRIRLLDFGVATRLDPGPAVGLIQGRHLTPAYASPDRLAGKPTTVQSDVYALGVILHELLADRLPRTGRGEARAASANTSLRTRPENRGADWQDLDHICATAVGTMGQGYSSVEAMQRDLRHWLARLPLDSRPRSPWYRLRKFTQRERRSLALTSLLVGLSGGALMVHDRTLERARTSALAEAARTNRLKQFLENLFQGGGAAPGAIDSVRVATLVENGIREARALTTDPAAQIDLLETLAIVSERMGQYDRADTLILAAIERSMALYGRTAPQTLRVNVRRASVLGLRQQRDSAELLLRHLEAQARRLPDPEHPVAAEVYQALGVLLRDTGRSRDALPFLRRAVAMRVALDTTSREHAEALRELGIALATASQLAAADSVWKRALPLLSNLLGPRHPEVGYLYTNLGYTSSLRGDLQVAERYQREAAGILGDWYGADHYLTAVSMGGLVQTLIRMDRAREVLPMLERIIRSLSSSREFGPDHAQTAIARTSLGTAHSKLGDHRRARVEFERARRTLERTLGPTNTSTLNTAANAAKEMVFLGHVDSALVLTKELWARAERGQGARTVVAANMRAQHGLALVEASRAREAIPLLEASVALLDTLLGGPGGLSVPVRQGLARAYEAAGDSVKARQVRAVLAAPAGSTGKAAALR
jgi:eukaryotic-like serine/threonine-protein kinase